MEDRYLFKAKHMHILPCNDHLDGSWVVGFLSGERYIANDSGEYLIDPSTICQCTGLKDKNGKPVWENDIVKFDIYYYEKLESSTISQIKWCNGLCALSLVVNDKGTRGTLGHLMDLNKEIEVIGNIFDNGELLESEEI